MGEDDLAKIILNLRSERTRSLDGGSVLSAGLLGTGEAGIVGRVGELVIGEVWRLGQALRSRPDEIVGTTASNGSALGLDMTLDSRGCKGAAIHDGLHDEVIYGCVYSCCGQIREKDASWSIRYGWTMEEGRR